MSDDKLDLSYLEELSGGSRKYKHDVLEIFLGTTPDGVVELQRIVDETDDFVAVSKQAHFLKSGFSIIKVEGMYEKLAEIEKISLQAKDKEEFMPQLQQVLADFNEVLPLLLQEKDKYAQA